MTTPPIAPIRPRFTMTVSDTFEACIARLEQAIDNDPGHHSLRVLERHVDITTPPEHRHRWSPCVHLEFHEEDGALEVQGLIGPHPNVWTFYAVVAIHFVLAFAFGLLFGLVQVSLDESAWALWIALGAALGVAGMYFLARAGQRLAREETRALRDLVDRALAPSVSAP